MTSTENEVRALLDRRSEAIWVRTTSACRQSTNLLLIMHEHVSLPVDPKTGSAAIDLVP